MKLQYLLQQCVWWVVWLYPLSEARAVMIWSNISCEHSLHISIINNKETAEYQHRTLDPMIVIYFHTYWNEYQLNIKIIFSQNSKTFSTIYIIFWFNDLAELSLRSIKPGQDSVSWNIPEILTCQSWPVSAKWGSQFFWIFHHSLQMIFQCHGALYHLWTLSGQEELPAASIHHWLSSEYQWRDSLKPLYSHHQLGFQFCCISSWSKNIFSFLCKCWNLQKRPAHLVDVSPTEYPRPIIAANSSLVRPITSA